MVDAYLTGFRHMREAASADTRAFYAYGPISGILAVYLRRAGFTVTAVEVQNLMDDYRKRGTLLV